MYDNLPVTVAGFGKTEYVNISPILRKVDGRALSEKTCEMDYARRAGFRLSKDHFCVSPSTIDRRTGVQGHGGTCFVSIKIIDNFII